MIWLPEETLPFTSSHPVEFIAVSYCVLTVFVPPPTFMEPDVPEVVYQVTVGEARIDTSKRVSICGKKVSVLYTLEVFAPVVVLVPGATSVLYDFW